MLLLCLLRQLLVRSRSRSCQNVTHGAVFAHDAWALIDLEVCHLVSHDVLA